MDVTLEPHLHDDVSERIAIRSWSEYTLACTPDEMLPELQRAASRARLLLVPTHINSAHVMAGERRVGEISWRQVSRHPASGIGHLARPLRLATALFTQDCEDSADVGVFIEELHALSNPYVASEIHAIERAMPLLFKYSTRSKVLESWALIFRDHYLEHSVGFVLALERCGIPSEWILTFAKGDQTRNRNRVHATFLSRGYASGVLDNAMVDSLNYDSEDLERVWLQIDTFLDSAHTAGRRVLLVDDGGLIACGYASNVRKHRVDAAVELTVSGMKRIAAARSIEIPIIDMARSQVKTLLGYAEIADSCLRRLKSILPDRKFIGRRVLLLGFGTLGSRLAVALRSAGARVVVVDTSVLKLIVAAEGGFETCRSVSAALLCDKPFVIIGTSGEQSILPSDLDLLPDQIILAPFATRDFSVLRQSPRWSAQEVIHGVGINYRSSTGKTALMLGDGRSMNLFEVDSIPSEGYDAYRAATLIAVKELCGQASQLCPGVHNDFADRCVAASGLYDAYYNLYLEQTTAFHGLNHDVG